VAAQDMAHWHTQVKKYMAYTLMLSLDGGICTGATGRRQATCISLESWFHCFIVAQRVNTE